MKGLAYFIKTIDMLPVTQQHGYRKKPGAKLENVKLKMFGVGMGNSMLLKPMKKAILISSQILTVL